MLIIKNKRGWIRIVEAFVSIILIAGIVLIAVSQSQEKENPSAKIQNLERSVLREIQLNSTLRQEIVGISESSLPVEWQEFAALLPKTKAKIDGKATGIECSARICATNDNCLFAEGNEETVYVESVIISSTLQTYSPRTLKLFCWE